MRVFQIKRRLKGQETLTQRTPKNIQRFHKLILENWLILNREFAGTSGISTGNMEIIAGTKNMYSVCRYFSTKKLLNLFNLIFNLILTRDENRENKNYLVKSKNRFS